MYLGFFTVPSPETETMKHRPAHTILLLLVYAFCIPAVFAQSGNAQPFEVLQTRDLAKSGLRQELVMLPGWDPDEPVPGLVYYKPGQSKLPLVIYMHGLGGSKTQGRQPIWFKELAERGMYVVGIDAHLHGDRAVPGLMPKRASSLGRDAPIWFHQIAIAHTLRDIPVVIDALIKRPEVDASRIAFFGASMGGSAAIASACRDPRISVIGSIIGAVDFWYDVTKIPPGPEQDKKKKELCLRVRQIVDSLDPRQHCMQFAPRAVFFANAELDQHISIDSVRRFVETIRPQYKDFPDRLVATEEKGLKHLTTQKMWDDARDFLVRFLIEKPVTGSSK